MPKPYVWYSILQRCPTRRWHACSSKSTTRPRKRAGPRPRRSVPFRDILHLARPAGDGREAHRRVAAQRLRRRDASHPCGPFLARRGLSPAILRTQGYAAVLPRLYQAVLSLRRTCRRIAPGLPCPDILLCRFRLCYVLDLPPHSARRRGIFDSDTIVRHPASQRGVVLFGRNPGLGRYGASAPKGFENPLRRNAPGRRQIVFRPWTDCLPSVVRLPSGRGLVAFRPWTGCLPAVDRSLCFRPLPRAKPILR